MREKLDGKVGDALFERDSLHVRLNSTASKLLGARSLLTGAHERPEQHCGRLDASHLLLELLLVSSALGFVDRMEHLVSCERRGSWG